MTELADLARLHGWKTVVSPDMRCLEANRLFLERSELPGVIVREGETVALLSRARFREELTRPFRQEIYSSRPLRDLPAACFVPIVMINADTQIEAGAEMALNRPVHDIYEPVIVKLEGELAVLDVYHVFFALTGRLNDEVDRTRSLLRQVNRANDLLLQGINYASRLQGAMLPQMPDSPPEVETAILFRPRDQVSGDFFWFTHDKDRFFAVVADCTGHGVPGAMISMIAIPALARICETRGLHDPGGVFREWNMELRESIHGRGQSHEQSYDDGLEAVACSIELKSRKASVTSGGLGFHYLTKDGGDVVKAYREGLGYKANRDTIEYPTTEVEIPAGATGLMFTDGLTEQMGEEKRIMLGRRRLINLIEETLDQDLDSAVDTVRHRVDDYRGAEVIRDDQTLLAFRFNHGGPT